MPQPDSQKGTLEKAGDKMASAMDSGAAALQPNVRFPFLFHHRQPTNPFLQQSQKSASQKMSDGMMSGKGNSEVSGPSSFSLQQSID